MGCEFNFAGIARKIEPTITLINVVYKDIALAAPE
jgi:hypothetical protein